MNAVQQAKRVLNEFRTRPYEGSRRYSEFYPRHREYEGIEAGREATSSVWNPGVTMVVVHMRPDDSTRVDGSYRTDAGVEQNKRAHEKHMSVFNKLYASRLPSGAEVRSGVGYKGTLSIQVILKEE